MARRWWRKRALCIYHPHMSVDEMVSLDVPAFAADCVETNAEMIVVNAAGLHAYYPTDVDCHHVPEALGNRDLLGEIVDALRAQGLRVIGRCDFAQVRREDAEEHPEWMALDDQGGETLQMCPTSPYQGEAFALPVVRELMARYPLDGLFFDGNGYPCEDGCPSCKSQFGSEEGQGLEWLIWRQEKLAAAERALCDAAKSADPAAFCFSRNDGVSAGRSVPDSDLVAQGHALTVLGIQAESGQERGAINTVGLSVELARGARRKRRPLVIIAPGAGAPDTGPRQPLVEQMRVAYQAVAHGASVMIESARGPRTVGERHVTAIRDGFARMRAQASVLDAGFKPFQNVGLVWPTAAATRARGSGDTARIESMLGLARGLSLALQSGHCQYGVLHDRRITIKSLARCQAVVVPGMAPLDECKLALLRDYVVAGGRALVVDTCPSVRPGNDHALDAMSRMLGCSLSIKCGHGTLAVPNTEMSSPLRERVGAMRMWGGRHRSIIDAGDALVWVREGGSGEPLMVSQMVGEGMLTYCAWPVALGLESRPQQDVASLIVQALRFGAQLPPRLNVDAPGCIEVTMAHWREGIVIHLVNHAGALMGDVTPVGPVMLDLAWDGPAQVVLAVPGQPDQALPTQDQWNRVSIKVPRVDVYAQVVVRTG